VSELPRVGVDENGDISIQQTTDGEVHVYAHPTESVVIHQQNNKTKKVSYHDDHIYNNNKKNFFHLFKQQS